MIRGALLDISGVLYEGDKAVPGAVEAVARLRAADIPVRFLTNSTRRPKRVIVEKLHCFGFDVDPGEILTPAAAACAWLSKNGHAPHLLVHPDLDEDFAECTQHGPTAVIVGDAGRTFIYDRLNAAFRLIMDGAPFLALAANRVFKDEDGDLSMDAGAFVRALEYSSSTEAMLLGKPAPAFFTAGAESLGFDLGDVVMIGDDAESDVAGALSAGLGEALLVRTGKYSQGDEYKFTPCPTAVAANIGEAIGTLLKRSRK